MRWLPSWPARASPPRLAQRSTPPWLRRRPEQAPSTPLPPANLTPDIDPALVRGDGGRPRTRGIHRMSLASHRPRPIVLVVVDGFGLGPDPAADAIQAAPMPHW